MLGASLLAAGCAASPRPIEVRQTVPQGANHAIEVRLIVQPEHAAYAGRYMESAAAAVATIAEWLGTFEQQTLTLADPDWHGRSPAAADAIVMPRVRWWTTRTSMAPELAAARAVSRRFWAGATHGGELPDWFVDALGELTARRTVVPLFAVDNIQPGYAFLEQRFFDGFAARFVRIRLMVDTDGPPLVAYRTHPDVVVDPHPATMIDRDALAGKTMLALGTLDRWLGRPVMDEILAAFVRAARTGESSQADFERIASDVSGQDLSWFFNETFRSSARFDYGIEELTSEHEGDAFVTVVTARRYGDAVFPGTSAPRVGAYESGRGVTVAVRFADGRLRTDFWDGRDRRKAFRYRSTTPAVSAAVDPDRTLLLDMQRINNTRTRASDRTPAARWWAARYELWLQHLLLTYASLV